MRREIANVNKHELTDTELYIKRLIEDNQKLIFENEMIKKYNEHLENIIQTIMNDKYRTINKYIEKSYNETEKYNN